MAEWKKPATAFQVLLFAWLLAGTALWMLIVTAPAQSVALDDPLGIDECPGANALQGTSLPYWPWAAGREPRDDPLPRLAVLPPFLAARDSLAGAIFRLQLVRLHPPVGPPCAVFAGQLTG